jgi:hypothetical protein
MDSAGARHPGGCRCGRVRIELRGDPIITMACHCTGCQKMTGSAYSLSALHAVSDFDITEGTTVIGGLHGAARHHFCGHCLSWMFTFPEGLADYVNVRATMIDDCHDYAPFVETQTDEALPWAATGARHSFARFPTPEEFPALIAEFAAGRG